MSQYIRINANSFKGGNKRTPIDKEDVKADLTSQRPVYPLSCYGPGKTAPRQLIEGNFEISPEELRLRYYTQRASVGEAAAVRFSFLKIGLSTNDA